MTRLGRSVAPPREASRRLAWFHLCAGLAATGIAALTLDGPGLAPICLLSLGGMLVAGAAATLVPVSRLATACWGLHIALALLTVGVGVATMARWFL